MPALCDLHHDSHRAPALNASAGRNASCQTEVKRGLLLQPTIRPGHLSNESYMVAGQAGRDNVILKVTRTPY